MIAKLSFVLFVASCSVATCQGEITKEGCINMKTCYMDPPNCTLTTPECRFFAWTKTEGESYEFIMRGGTGKGKQYIAIALGTKSAMQDADLYYCDGDAVRTGVIQDLHKPPKYFERTDGVSTVEATSIDGVAQCIFIRPASVTRNITNNVTKNFDITKEEFHLLWAVGAMESGGPGIRYHNKTKGMSNGTINFAGGNIDQNPITDTDCGNTKACYKDPTGCTMGNSECRFFSWTKNEEELYEFEMSGGTGAGKEYIAMAFGTKSAMEDADLYYCDGDAVRTGAIQDLHTPPAYGEMTDGLATVKATTINGVAQCVFVRPASINKVISKNVNKDFDITKEEFYLLWAVGQMATGPNITYHGNKTRGISSKTINFGGGEIIENPITDTDCDNTKTCFKDPVGCSVGSAGCRFFSWSKNEEELYEIEMSGGTGAGKEYIAMAFGTTSAMKDADLYYCDGVAVRTGAIQDLHTPPAYNEMTDGLATVKATTINGVAQCVFVRPASINKVISKNVNKDFDITKEEFYLLWAVGQMATGPNITYHGNKTRGISSKTINFGGEEIIENPITDTDCDNTKTCFKDPVGCSVGSAGCRFFSWSKNSESEMYDFEMAGGSGNGDQYIAMALGTKSAMQDADLYYCDGKTVRTGALQELHHPPMYSEMTGGLATKSASTTNGVAQCVFSRPASVTKTISGGMSKTFNITKEEYYLLGAIGPMNGTHINKHNVWRTVTSNTYNFGASNSNALTDTDCGVTKTCLKHPADCVIGTSDCRFYSWAKVEDGYNFEMSGGIGNGVEYVSFALGTIDVMQDADSYYCDGTTVRSAAIQDYHMEPAYLEMNNGLSTISAQTIDGVAHCVMNRPASVGKVISSGEVKDFNLEEENYYFLAAVGPMKSAHLQKHGSSEIQRHTWRMVTDERVVQFSSVGRVQMLSPCLLAFLALLIMKSSEHFTA